MTNIKPHEKALINLVDSYKKQQHIADALRSLLRATEASKNRAFHDKELHEKVLQLVAFFNRKYIGTLEDKKEGNN